MQPTPFPATDFCNVIREKCLYDAHNDISKRSRGHWKEVIERAQVKMTPKQAKGKYYKLLAKYKHFYRLHKRGISFEWEFWDTFWEFYWFNDEIAEESEEKVEDGNEDASEFVSEVLCSNVVDVKKEDVEKNVMNNEAKNKNKNDENNENKNENLILKEEKINKKKIIKNSKMTILETTKDKKIRPEVLQEKTGVLGFCTAKEKSVSEFKEFAENSLKNKENNIKKPLTIIKPNFKKTNFENKNNKVDEKNKNSNKEIINNENEYLFNKKNSTNLNHEIYKMQNNKRQKLNNNLDGNNSFTSTQENKKINTQKKLSEKEVKDLYIEKQYEKNQSEFFIKKIESLNKSIQELTKAILETNNIFNKEN
ncbi:hypothetical protein COBT_001976 [Conglomerata obtusa]